MGTDKRDQEKANKRNKGHQRNTGKKSEADQNFLDSLSRAEKMRAFDAKGGNERVKGPSVTEANAKKEAERQQQIADKQKMEAFKAKGGNEKVDITFLKQAQKAEGKRPLSPTAEAKTTQSEPKRTQKPAAPGKHNDD